MKYFWTFLIFCLFTFLGCKKDNTNYNLYGNWRLTEYYYSTGGPGVWTPASQKNSNSLLILNSSGKISGSYYTDYKRFTVKDSVTLVFYKDDNTFENYNYQIKGATLTLSPAGPIVCIEGCADRFMKLGN